MHRNNIKEVHFNYQGSGVISAALQRTGIYSPQNIEAWLKRRHAVTTEHAKEKDVSLFIGMEMKPEPQLTFLVFQYQDMESDDSDFNIEARKLGEFDISIPKTLGSKNWKFYTDQKDRRIFDVKTPADILDADSTMENFHAYLAKKLQGALKKHGLASILENDNDTNFEHMLIGLFLEYRELQTNPQLLMRRLGL